MDDAPTVLRNDFESAVGFLIPTGPVPKKSKEKRSVTDITATTSYEKKPPRKNNNTQGGKQGEKLKSCVGKMVYPYATTNQPYTNCRPIPINTNSVNT